MHRFGLAVFISFAIAACGKTTAPSGMTNSDGKPVAPEAARVASARFEKDGKTINELLHEWPYAHDVTWIYVPKAGGVVMALAVLNGSYQCAMDWPIGGGFQQTMNVSPCSIKNGTIMFAFNPETAGIVVIQSQAEVHYKDGDWKYQISFSKQENQRELLESMDDIFDKHKWPDHFGMAMHNPDGDPRGLFIK